MAEPTHDDSQPVRPRAEQERMEKLRALGLEMRLWDHFKAELADTRRNFADRERELQAQLENSRLQLQQVLTSRSWKITQPLRDVTKWVGKGDDVPDTRPGSVAETSLGPTPPPHQLTPVEAGVDSVEDPASAPEAPIDRRTRSNHSTDGQLISQASTHSAEDFVTGGKAAWDEAGRRRLEEFLSSGRRLSFPTPAQPTVSIIVALYNKAHLGILCFASLLQNAGDTYELILIDNGSSDDTGKLLERIDGAKIIRNGENTGFGNACVQGAEVAVGEYLCFLNNDVVLRPGTLEAAIANFRNDPSVGAVGGMLLLSDGRLQEAGSIVWRDGTAWGYGRGDNASSPKYAFRRPVDYCSGALLFTPRTLFDAVGRFDQRFSPAYYEDTDYCFKVWESGRKVVYEPKAAVHHYESASMQNSEAADRLIAEHRAKFTEKWKAKLQGQLPLAGAAVPYARIAVGAKGARILYLCERIPHRDSGPRFAAANDFITALASEGHHVTCVSMTRPFQDGEYNDIPAEVELADARSDAHYLFRELLTQYDAIWIAQSPSMREFLVHMRDMAQRVPTIVYEVSEISSGEDSAFRGSFDEELTLCYGADIVLVPTEEEKQKLQPHLTGRIEVRSEEMARRILSEVSNQPGAHLSAS